MGPSIYRDYYFVCILYYQTHFDSRKRRHMLSRIEKKLEEKMLDPSHLYELFREARIIATRSWPPNPKTPTTIGAQVRHFILVYASYV